jgi:hypothetical protein
MKSQVNYPQTGRKEGQKWIVFSLGTAILISITLQIVRVFTTSIDCLIPYGGSPLPAALNYLVYERQLIRTAMATVYIIQNQNRIRTAIPLALMVIRRAIERVSGTALAFFSVRCLKVELWINTKYLPALRIINHNYERQLIISWRMARDVLFRGIGDSYFLWRKTEAKSKRDALSFLRHPTIVFSN